MSAGVESVEPGTRIGTKYEVERVLGEGGMGIVVAAREIDTERRVAIKIVRRGLLDTDEAVQRFQLEARTLASLDSEHVVRIFELGRLDDSTPFMVMEQLDGADLATVARQRAPLPIRAAVGWVLEAIQGLAEAHRAGVVHRDLKPGNLFLARRADGTEIVKVLDFGIAKSLAGGPALTKEGFVLGSPSYMSPEQLQSSRSVDERTDVWALGAILYELLAGQPPFEGRSIDERLIAILRSARAPLRELRPDVPAELEAAIDDCLVVDPGRRIRDVTTLAGRLAPFGPRAAAAAPAFVDAEPRSDPAVSLLPRPTAPWKIAVVALLLIGVATLVLAAVR